MTEYVNRRTLFEKEQRFALTGDALALESGGRTTSIPYEEIAGVALRFMPNRYDENVYRCALETKDRREFLLFNKYVEGFRRFRDQSSAYRAFVLELHERLKGRPGIAFRGGLSPASYWASLAALAGVGLLVAGSVIVFPVDFSLTILLRLVFIAYLIWTGRNYYRFNKPAAYSPEDVPTRLLPRESGGTMRGPAQ